MTSRHWNQLAHYGLYLLIFLLPWQARWIFTGEPSWPYGQISLYATQVLLFAVVTATLLGRTASRDGFQTRLYWPAWALELWAIAASLWAADQGVALYHASLIISAVLLGECVLLLRPDPQRIAMVLFGTGLIQALLAISQFTSQYVFPSTLLGLAEHSATAGHAVLQTSYGLLLRAYGTLPHPNILGAWLAVAWLCGLGLRIPQPTPVMNGKTQRAASLQLILNVGLVVIASGLLLTFSRGAWLAAAVGTAWILIVTSQRISWRRAVASGAVILIAATALTLPLLGTIAGRLPGNDAALEQLSYSSRQQSLVDGWQLVQQSPLLGYGVAPLTEPPHLVPLTITVDLGLIGLVLVLLLAWQMRPRLLNWYSPLWAVPLIAGLVDHHWWTLWAGLSLGALILTLPRGERSAGAAESLPYVPLPPQTHSQLRE
jgi:O-antigen ligase